MIRVIKRYESRKLYDTEESRYVSLEDLAAWVREGQEVKVIDNATAEDVTPQILTQIILEGGKRGTSFLPTELLHELVRTGERAFQSGVEQVQSKVDHIVKRSIDRLAPVRKAREEMSRLRERLAELESTLVKLEKDTGKSKPASRKATARKTTARKTTARKTAATKATKSGKTASAKTARTKTASAKKSAAKKSTAKKSTAKKSTTAVAKKRTTALAKKGTTAIAKTGTKKASRTTKKTAGAAAS